MQKLTEDQIDLITTLYRGGWSSRKVAEFTNVSKTAVLTYVNSRPYGPVPKYEVEEDFFEIIDNELSAYWLGVIFGDGYISSPEVMKGRDHYVKITVKDRDWLEDFRSDIKSNAPIGIVREKYYSLQICNRKFRQDLIDKGLMPGEKHDKLIYPDIPKELDRHFIRGLFDADGSIWKSKTARGRGLFFSITGSLDFLNVVQDKMIEHLNISKTKLAERKPGKGDIRYGGSNNIDKIYNWFYKDSERYLKRKFDKFNL